MVEEAGPICFLCDQELKIEKHRGKYWLNCEYCIFDYGPCKTEEELISGYYKEYSPPEEGSYTVIKEFQI